MIELSYATQRKLLFVIMGMLVIVWGTLGYFWIDNVQIKHRLEIKEAVDNVINSRSDSLKRKIIINQNIIIRKQDSLLYPKPSTNGK